MSDPPSGLPARPSLEQLRKQAKDLLQRARAGDAAAVARFAAVSPRLSMLRHSRLASSSR